MRCDKNLCFYGSDGQAGRKTTRCITEVEEALKGGVTFLQLREKI